jgi:hypothetical protein
MKRRAAPVECDFMDAFNRESLAVDQQFAHLNNYNRGCG